MDGFPLLAWTRPLSSAERAAELEVEQAREAADLDADPQKWIRDYKRDQTFDLSKCDPRHLSSWLPVLPDEVPKCEVCTLPSTKELCSSCQRLLKLHGRPIASLEFLTVCGKRDGPERTIWDWKESTVAGDGPPDDWLSGVSTALSAHLDAHQERLLAGDPLITTVPSRAPVIDTAMHSAAARGWFSADISALGDKHGDWLQHKMSGQAERLGRTPNDWSLRTRIAHGRPVLLLDDVFVTGASMYSYAEALKQAGALEVRCLAIVRHVADSHWNYYDALRIVRRKGPWDWATAHAFFARR